MTVRATRASRRRRCGAQAVIETALIIPIMLFLVAAFLALTLQIETQSELDTATKVAAESVFQAPRAAVDPSGTRCCGGLRTAGLPTGCRYAAETYYGTMQFYDQYLDFSTTTKQLCSRGGVAPDKPGARSATAVPGSPNAKIQCDVAYKDRNPQPIVSCYSSATLRFSRTPLAWAIFWNPILSSTAEAVPPPFRQ